MLVNDILYHVAMDGILRIVPLGEDRRRLIQEAHGGKLAGHLRDARSMDNLVNHTGGRG